MASRRHSRYSVINTPEILYAKHLTAAWLARLLDCGVPCNEAFLDCVEWCTGNIKYLPTKIINTLKRERQTPRIANALEKLQSISHSSYAFSHELESITQYSAPVRTLLCHYVTEKLHKTLQRPIYKENQTKKIVQETFGINDNAYIFCEFIFLNQIFKAIENYFEDSFQFFVTPNRHLFARMLNMNVSTLKSCIAEMESFGILTVGHVMRLHDSMLALWENPRMPSTLFCCPLDGNCVDLKNFSLPQDTIAHVTALLSQPGDTPVHILLYGPPGTGKTTFANSVAKALGLKAWAVNSRKDDDDDDRRTSLTACLHMASKHKGAFVLVDEAERLLSTEMQLFQKSKDKAWLNALLEQPGKRVIWISNKIDHIDQAVRRRFTFSLFFDTLSLAERGTMWQQLRARYRVEKRLSTEQCNFLTKHYDVPVAVIEQAIQQAKQLYRSPQKFYQGLERVLQAYVTLQQNGVKQEPALEKSDAYILDGICLDGSTHDLLSSCTRIDAAFRQNAVGAGAGTMLFYGPPGTGKTALAYHIAQSLQRDCVVKRASDLLSPYVGVTEQHVAATFRAAEKNGAVLLIDEVDTFLYSREMAQRSWESSLVNEFLTALERYRGFCICTTNRRDHLDPAAMRRFSHKVAFDYAKPKQVLALYKTLLAPLCKASLPLEWEEKLLTLTRLTPGDFHAVRAQYASFFSKETARNHPTFVDALIKEQSLKNEPRRMGFA